MTDDDRAEQHTAIWDDAIWDDDELTLEELPEPADRSGYRSEWDYLHGETAPSPQR
jgi:hypothetical protein